MDNLLWKDSHILKTLIIISYWLHKITNYFNEDLSLIFLFYNRGAEYWTITFLKSFNI